METNDLQIMTREHNGVPVVTARGDVDLCTQDTLRSALNQYGDVAAAGTGVLAVDIQDVAFIDSAGLALLVEMRKRFTGKCVLSLVIAAGSQPERVLKLGRFDTFLRVCYSIDEAAAPIPPTSAATTTTTTSGN